MSGTLNMAIDDYNSTRKPRGRSSRRGGRVSTSHSGSTSNRNARLRNAPYVRQRPPRGDINGPWSHDLFEDGNSNNRRSVAANSRRATSNSNGNNKLVVENLFYEVTQEDLEELFSECGTVKKVYIHYDRAGRSTGVADVVFEASSEAEAALRKYNGKTLDGQQMKIKYAPFKVTQRNTTVRGSSNSSGAGGSVMDRLGGAPVKSARGNIRERLGNASSPTPASRGRGHGRSRGTNNSDSRQKPSNRKPVTYDDLDADLDAYMAIDDELGTGQNTSKALSGENGMDLS